MASNSSCSSESKLPPPLPLRGLNQTQRRSPATANSWVVSASASWFHGSIQRHTAVKRLKSVGRPGAYLVRESQTFQGDYVISYLNHSGKVIHIRVIFHCGKYFVGAKQFSSMEAVITYFSNNVMWKNESLGVPVISPKPAQLYKMLQATTSYNKRQNSDELVLIQGEVLLLMNKLNDRWGWGRSQWTGESGLIILKLTKDLSDNEDINYGKPWFHGLISRGEAYRRLMKLGKKGSFLLRRVRKSTLEQSHMMYSLSVRSDSKDQIEHFLIAKSTLGYRLEGDNTTYNSIEDIIEHYQSNVGATLKLEKYISPKYAAVFSAPLIPTHRAINCSNSTLHQAVPPGDKDGDLLLCGKNNEWKNFYFVLDYARRRLLYYDHAMMYCAKGLMDLRRSSVCAVHPSLFGRHDCLVVMLPPHDSSEVLCYHYLAATSAELAQEWIKVIRQCTNSEKLVHFRLTLKELILHRNYDKIFINVCIDGVYLAKTMDYSNRNGSYILNESFDFEVMVQTLNNCTCEIWADQSMLGYVQVTFSDLIYPKRDVDKCYSLISSDQTIGSVSQGYLKLHTIISNSINLEEYKKVKEEQKDYEQLDKEFILPERSPQKGFILAAYSAVGLVYLPTGHTMKHFIKLTACDIQLHPKLNANEVLLTQVVCISPCDAAFTPNMSAIIELMKIIKVTDAKQQLALLFCNSSTIVSQEWKDLKPHLHNCEVLGDRILFTTNFFGYFAVIGRFCNPSASVTIEPENNVQNQLAELKVPELVGFKVEIPMASVQSPVEITATIYYDDPKLCNCDDQKSLATAFVALEPHNLQFAESIPIVMPIPNYAQIIDDNPGIELELWHSTLLENNQTKWELISNSDFKVTCDTEGNHVATVYTNHFSYYTYLWNKSVEYCMNFFTEKISGRCQVFMSQEVKYDSFINFGIAVLLYPFQDPYETLQNYDYILFDSGVPIEIVTGKLQCIIKLNDFLVSGSCTLQEYYKDTRLSKNFSARADFSITLNAKRSSELPRGMTLANLLIKHGHEGVEPHEFNLIKPLKKEISSIETSVDPVLQVKLPSLTSCKRLKECSLQDIQSCLWNARVKWQTIGLALGIDITTLEVIKRNNPYDNDAAFQAMLLNYLRKANPVPCWKDLAQALMSTPVGVAAELDEELVPSVINPIEYVVHHLYETTEQFEGDMVDSVENVADYMMKMALCARIAFKADTEGSSDSAKDDLVKSASLIAQESSNFAEMARKMASSCNEQGLKQAILQLVDRLPSITRQLEVITESTRKKDYDPEGSQMAADLLTENARNLISAMMDVLHATERAVIKIPPDEIKKLNLKLVVKQVNN